MVKKRDLGMDRFMSHEHLARDRRFKRMENRNQLLRSLPNDVQEIVRIFEKVGPKIRERIAGTEVGTRSGCGRSARANADPPLRSRN